MSAILRWARTVIESSGDADLWVQRLTLPEYIETVKSAVEVDISAEAKEMLPLDNRADGFRNTAYNLNVDLKHVEAYAKLARTIVSKMDVESFARKFSKSKKLTDNNMRTLISELGKRVLRGPLEEQEVVLYRGISTTVASAGGDFREAVGMVLEAMLQSPRFLYRVENRRGDGSTWPVSEYELASRVSYISWGAPPDDQLLAAADAGELGDPELFRDQINRMLDDPRAVQRSRQFVIDWLNLDRLENMRPNEDRFPNWQQQLGKDMRAETIEFFVDLVWKQQRPLSDLLNAQFTYATPRLAKHYGYEAQGEGLQRYDLTDVPSRGGLLTQGSLLTIGGDDASMVTRGLFVLHDLLFGQVGDPPPGLDTTPVPSSCGAACWIQSSIFTFDDSNQLGKGGSGGCSHEWWHCYNPEKRNEQLRAHAHMKLREVAYFLARLDNTTEANGKSILENSCITISTESGDGRHSDPKRELSGVFHAITGAGGRFKTGQIIDVGHEGIDVYNTMLASMGAKEKLGPSDREGQRVDKILT